MIHNSPAIAADINVIGFTLLMLRIKTDKTVATMIPNDVPTKTYAAKIPHAIFMFLEVRPLNKRYAKDILIPQNVNILLLGKYIVLSGVESRKKTTSNGMIIIEYSKYLLHLKILFCSPMYLPYTKKTK